VNGDITNTVAVTGLPVIPLAETVTDTATAFVTVVTPSLEITKSASPARVIEGGTVTFTIGVTNSGNITLTDINVTDPQVSDCDNSLSPLPPLSSTQYTCRQAGLNSTLENTATVTAVDLIGKPVSGGVATATVEVVSASFEITKVVATPLVLPGTEVVFTITLTNTGDITLTTTVSDTRTPGCDRSLNLTPAGSLDSTQSYTCTDPGADNDFTNVVVATGTNQALLPGQIVTASAEALVNVIAAKVEVAKVPALQYALVNDVVTFTFYITNTGEVTVTRLMISDPRIGYYTDTLSTVSVEPYGGTFSDIATTTVTADMTNTVVVTGFPISGGTVTGTAIARVDVVSPGIVLAKSPASQILRAGGTAQFTLTVTNTGDITLTGVVLADPDTDDCGSKALPDLAGGAFTTTTCHAAGVGTSFTNTARVTAVPSPLPGVSVTDTATATVNVITPSLTILKAPLVQPAISGSTVGFTITVTNNGTVALDPVIVEDIYPDATCDKNIGNLLPTQFSTYTCVMTVGIETITNTVVVTGTAPDGGQPATARADARVNVVGPRLEISKVADEAQVQENQPVTFTISVTNTGDITLTVDITDTVTPDCARTVSDFGPFGTGITTYTCLHPGALDDFTNVVTATGTTTLPNGDPVTTTARAEAPVTIIGPDITITKVPEFQYALSQMPVVFSITITNTGDSMLGPITVTDVLAPECGRFISMSPPAARTSYGCTITPTADLTNTVVVTAQPPAGDVLVRSDMAVVDVISPSIKVVKLPLSQEVPEGGTAYFTMTITNTGDITLTNVVLTDPTSDDCGTVSLGTLPSRGITTVTCLKANISGNLTNTVVVSGTPPVGGVVTDTAKSTVTRLVGSLDIGKRPDVQYISPGETAYFTITVTNTGQIALTEVQVDDAAAADCSRTITQIIPADGSSYTFNCQADSVGVSFTNTVVATGTFVSGPGRVVSDTSYVDAELPDRPTLISPPNMSYTNTHDVTFEWSGPPEAISYTLLVSGTMTPVNAPTTTSTVDVGADGVYSWTVRSFDVHGRQSSYTDTWRVTVDTTPPSAPTLLGPLSSSTITETKRPEFSWSPAVDALSGPVTYTLILTSSRDSVGVTPDVTSPFSPTGDLLPGVYTWTIVANDRAGNSTVSAQVFTFTLENVVGDLYIPIVFKGASETARPDLVPLALIVEPANPSNPTTEVTLGVVLQNQGNATAGQDFWVDFYINPSFQPTTAGFPWNNICGVTPCYGLAWQVGETVAPGEVITLTSTGAGSGYLDEDFTVWLGFFNRSGNQTVGVYVDSWDGYNKPEGFIPESNETNNARWQTVPVGPGRSQDLPSTADAPWETITERPRPGRR
jgi:uncharacterized repeat protein (TIGR01451 family)